jgi:hypothetical protein
VIWLLPFLGAAFPAAGWGRGDVEKPQLITVQGRVRLVGNGSQMELVITGEDREWYIDRKEWDNFMKLQQQIVTVQGQETFVDLTFANGMPAGRRYILKNITLIRQDAAGCRRNAGMTEGALLHEQP